MPKAVSPLAGAAAALLFSFPFLPPAALPAAAEVRGKVIAVADGDTVTVLTPGRTSVRVRLGQIDAPERGQAFGERSRQALSSLVAGREVVVTDESFDRYGRTVGTVLVPPGGGGRPPLDANLAQVEAGMAWAYRRYVERPRLLDAEAEAKAARRGLWSDPAPVPPWLYRAEERDRRAGTRRR